MSDIAFEYSTIRISDIKVTEHKHCGNGITVIEAQDKLYAPTSRFWLSLFARFGFNKSFFTYFTYEEVFSRIAEKQTDDFIRICVEKDGLSRNFAPMPFDITDTLLAVSSPSKPIVSYEDICMILDMAEGNSDHMYRDGQVIASFVPRSNCQPFQIGGDTFNHKFQMVTPIDGYGAPSFILGLDRKACQNEIIAAAKAFKSTLSLGNGGDEIKPNLVRAVQCFNSAEGYAALRQRIDAASRSWASVYEANSLYRIVTRMALDQELIEYGDVDGTISSEYVREVRHSGQLKGTPLLSAYYRMTGDAIEIYGLANLDALSIKRQRTLPVKCKVMDLINFASEIATHHTDDAGAVGRLNDWLGTMLSSEFDMEGTADDHGDFADFLIEKDKTTTKE